MALQTAVSVESALEQALAIVERACREEGIDPETVPPPPPPGLMELVLQRAGLDWANAYRAVGGPDVAAIVVAAKAARIACAAELDGGDADDLDLRASDLHPNLLLIERLLDDARAMIDARRPPPSPELLARFDEADRCLRGLLAPMLAEIAASDRAAIEALAAAGRAPSPFSILRLR